MREKKNESGKERERVREREKVRGGERERESFQRLYRAHKNEATT